MAFRSNAPIVCRLIFVRALLVVLTFAFIQGCDSPAQAQEIRRSAGQFEVYDAVSGKMVPPNEDEIALIARMNERLSRMSIPDELKQFRHRIFRVPESQSSTEAVVALPTVANEPTIPSYSSPSEKNYDLDYGDSSDSSHSGGGFGY